MPTHLVDQVGKKTAKALWPAISFAKAGSSHDRAGVDGWLDGVAFQLKTDVEIARTGRLYKELKEKDKGHPEQAWRDSPSRGDYYIFVSRSLALLVPTAELSRAIRQHSLLPGEPNPTSRGYLIPIYTLEEGTGYYGKRLSRPVKAALERFLKPQQMGLF